MGYQVNKKIASSERTNKKINWAILVTGWGQNASDVIRLFNKGSFKKSDLSLVVCESEPCGAKDMAEKCNIEVMKIKSADFCGQDTYQNHLIENFKTRNIDYVLLLGYKYIFKETMLSAFPNRIINIHPSLFPSFLATQTAIQDAIDYGVKVTGITTHIIDDKIDRGIILCQEPIKIKPTDTFESLYPKFSKKGKKIIAKTIKHIENRC